MRDTICLLGRDVTAALVSARVISQFLRPNSGSGAVDERGS